VAIEELRRIERLLEAVSQQARPPSAPSADAIGEIEPAVRSVAQLATLRAVVRRVRVEVDVAGSLAPARIAGDALRQILLNLALNAIEATPEGGGVRISALERGDAIEIALEDEGPGVPEALRARVFEPFFSTKAQPGGLGLAITRRLVEDAGGTIEVESRTPTGSRFRVTLPAAR
jgi:signal transduction histidine kinase